MAGCSAIGEGGFSGSPQCTLVIPNTLLLRLYEEGKGYVEGVNNCVARGLLTLNPTCSRIASALRKAASRLHGRKRRCKGSRDRDRLRDGETHVLVGEGEVLTARGLQEEVHKQEVNIIMLMCEQFNKHVMNRKNCGQFKPKREKQESNYKSRRGRERKIEEKEHL